MTNNRTRARARPAAKRSRTDDYDAASSLGNGTDDDAKVAITYSPLTGKALFMPQSLRDASPEQLELVALLQKSVVRRQSLLDLIDGIVGDLRAAGTSWNGIGWCVGTTGEAARQRWGSTESSRR